MSGVLLYLVALRFAAGSLDPIWWVLVVVPLLMWPVSGSSAPLILWVVLLIAWVNGTHAGSLSWWSVLAAAGTAISHGATALSDSGPPTWTVPASLVRHWFRWLALGVGAAALVAALATLLTGRTEHLSPAAYGLGLAGLALGIWALRTNPPQTPL
jgi:FtsH-binding integral membrane protein